MSQAHDDLPGYRGLALALLSTAGVKVGDILRITSADKAVDGVLMPRTTVGDDRHVVLKLKTGYNVGVRVESSSRIAKIGEGQQPSFTRPPPPPHRSGLPKVAIVSTGGTIASKVDYRTGAVQSALTAEDLYSVVPELADIANVTTDVLYNVFSENLTPEHWKGMANTVAKYIKDGVDGVIIAQGTDTLGYTAAALSFVLQDLPVPVFLVGAQRSSDRPSSDAAPNLIGAVSAAARAPFAVVGVAMHDSTGDKRIVIHRGTKVRKCHTSRRDAFRSINDEPLAIFDLGDNTLDVNATDLPPRDKSRMPRLQTEFERKVTLLKFHPAMDPIAVDHLVNEGYRGIVLEGTGLGHVSEAWFPALRNAIGKGLFVGMTSQCLWGTVHMNVYSTGRDLQQIGVVPLGDMLPETALVKLMWALGKSRDVKDVNQLMLTNIAGEYSQRRPTEEVAPA
jgi:glutamyl-tRNA(Gln) amidotransferase subunit D